MSRGQFFWAAVEMCIVGGVTAGGAVALRAIGLPDYVSFGLSYSAAYLAGRLARGSLRNESRVVRNGTQTLTLR